MLHMPRETAKRAHELGDTRCALLATDGTVRAGIYDEAFAAEGIELLKPDAEGQRAVMNMIYSGVKAGRHDYDTAAVHRALESWFLVDDAKFARICPAVIADLHSGAILTNRCPNPKYKQYTFVKEAEA